MDRRRGVALGGFMGVGKSTVGRLLSTSLALPFHDVDAILVARFGPIARQFDVDGEDVFRARERAVVSELGQAAPSVIATGGGAWVDARNRHALAVQHRLVVLTAPFDVLAARLGRDPTRPLWTDAARALYERRQAAYAIADRVIDTSEHKPVAIAEEIVGWMRAGS